MNYLKIAVGIFFIVSGVLFFSFLRMLNDPEIEGDSGRISLGLYFFSFVPIAIGLIILFLKTNKKSI